MWGGGEKREIVPLSSKGSEGIQTLNQWIDEEVEFYMYTVLRDKYNLSDVAQ